MLATMAGIHVLQVLTAFLVISYVAAKEKVYFLDLERMNVTYWNTKYYASLACSSRRYNRQDPMHYVNLHYETVVSLGNDVTVDVYVYEFLSNEYRRSFVEMHYKLCDLLFKDPTFGAVFTNRIPEMFKTCPFPKGIYHLENVSFPDVPLLKTFPFRKGRVFVYFSRPKSKERMVEGYIDMLIKTRWR